VATKTRPVGQSYETDTIPSTLPTPEELKAACDAAEAAIQALGLISWRVARIARASNLDEPECKLVDGDERPTWEHVGRLHLFVITARADLEELSDNFDSLKGHLDELAILALYEEKGWVESVSANA
jgi:hypothetical protein